MLELLIVLALVLLNGFFAMSEMSVVTSRKARLKQQAETSRTLAYLRSLPLMRDVARRIPSKWQRKVGSWLKG